MKLRLDVELTEHCPECSNGWLYPVDKEREPCWKCYGMGELATDNGMELLEFIRTFTDGREDAKAEYERWQWDRRTEK